MSDSQHHLAYYFPKFYGQLDLGSEQPDLEIVPSKFDSVEVTQESSNNPKSKGSKLNTWLEHLKKRY